MKKRSAIHIAILLACLISLPAFACVENIYTVAGDQDTLRKDVFAWDETPWAFTDLTVNNYDVGSVWMSPTGDSYNYMHLGTPDSGQQWFFLDTWDSVKEAGDWKLKTYFYYPGDHTSAFTSGSTCFTVTPEPLGCILFLLGAGALGLRGRRNRV